MYLILAYQAPTKESPNLYKKAQVTNIFPFGFIYPYSNSRRRWILLHFFFMKVSIKLNMDIFFSILLIKRYPGKYFRDFLPIIALSLNPSTKTNKIMVSCPLQSPITIFLFKNYGIMFPTVSNHYLSIERHIFHRTRYL